MHPFIIAVGGIESTKRAEVGALAGLNVELSRVVAQTIPNGAYALKVAKYQAAYMRAVRATWFRSTAAAEMILDHTNAFYVRRDDRPRRGPDRDKPFIVGEVCIHDSMVRSEVNARLEMLKGALMDEGIHVDELRIIPSTWGMKNRHPFANRGPAPAVDTVPSRENERPRSSVANLQIVKRAFCVVFGEGAESVLAQVGRAYLEEAPQDSTALDSRLSRWYFCHLYSADVHFPPFIEAYEGAIVSAARTLGLNLSSVQGHYWEGAAAEQAFPVAGYPMVSEEPPNKEGGAH